VNPALLLNIGKTGIKDGHKAIPQPKIPFLIIPAGSLRYVLHNRRKQPQHIAESWQKRIALFVASNLLTVCSFQCFNFTLSSAREMALACGINFVFQRAAYFIGQRFSAYEIISASGFDVTFSIGCFQIFLPPKRVLFIQTCLVIDQFERTPSFC
jgi:hypothetical protein